MSRHGAERRGGGDRAAHRHEWIHLERVEEYQQEEVTDGFMDLEEDHSFVGKSLVGELFPSD